MAKKKVAVVGGEYPDWSPLNVVWMKDYIPCVLSNMTILVSPVFAFSIWFLNQKYYVTRLHSSRMRTARLLTVSQHALHRRGCLPGGCLPRGVCPEEGVSTQGGVSAQPPPPPRTDRCKNITLPQLRCGR